VRPHGISRQSFLAYLLDLRVWVTVAFGTLLSLANSSAKHALYQVPVRQATISLSLLPVYPSRCKPWESLWGSSATMPLAEFHHRLTACPSYKKSSEAIKRLAACRCPQGHYVSDIRIASTPKSIINIGIHLKDI
jgi:hypothetical protein